MPRFRRCITRRQAVVGLSALTLVANPVRAARRAALLPAGRSPQPYRVPPAWADAVEVSSPSAVSLAGWLGGRVGINANQRLLNVETEPMLAGFRHKPGTHPWIGEHVGKWLHAATLAWSYNGDAALRSKLDHVAAALVATQEADGYLGTYVPSKRLALHAENEWDVWSHKYCLVGLITYHRYTGNAAALAACRKAADLMLATFPAQRSILAAGTHMGMAATSLLEPMVQLYRVTGDRRYLGFAHYMVRSWDEPGGPGVLKSLLQGKPMPKVGNGKAYETLANLVGLCELARVTGDHALVKAVLHAWQDVVDRRLFVTGTTSQAEYFQADKDWRDAVAQHIGETCVTTTWIQLNLSLLQLTGQARFGDELERSLYNHLTAAQHPGGNDWCYYTALDGRKQYDAFITCCHSSGPRGLALAPQAAYLQGHAKGHDVLLVSTFENSNATFMLDGQVVTVEQKSEFPYKGESTLTLRMASPCRFALKVREPEWAKPLNLTGATHKAGWVELPSRLWKDGDQLALRFNLGMRVMTGETTHIGRSALSWGPFVLAYDEHVNPDLPAPHKVGLTQGALPVLSNASAAKSLKFEGDIDARTSPTETTKPRRASFLTFADAGASAGRYRVWIRAPGVPPTARKPSASLLVDGEENRSRLGNGAGSIIDDDLANLANTFDGAAAAEDWYSVTLEEPAQAARFVFIHGNNYHDGGWFDTVSGKPRVQVQHATGADWTTVGELSDYPDTTATSAGALKGGQRFELRLTTPVRFTAVRVIGRPSSGDRPQQAFSSCTELQAFGL